MKTHIKNKIHPHVHAFDKALISFRAPEYIHHEKSALWFAIAGVIAILLVAYGLLTDGWTFSLAIIIFAGTYYLLHRHSPPTVEVKISKFGVKIGRHIFPYSRIKGFFLLYDPPFTNKLYFRMVSRFHPDIFIQMEKTDPAKARHILLAYLPEFKGVGEPFSDTLVRLFRL